MPRGSIPPGPAATTSCGRLPDGSKPAGPSCQPMTAACLHSRSRFPRSLPRTPGNFRKTGPGSRPSPPWPTGFIFPDWRFARRWVNSRRGAISMTLPQAVQAAVRAGELLPSAAENLLAFAAAQLPQWAGKSIDELVRRGEWAELNDRFYRYLEFGTGGMRGRTIGRVSPAAERGRHGPIGDPEHAAIGSNMLNDFTLVRATIGLFRHTRKFLSGRGE